MKLTRSLKVAVPSLVLATGGVLMAGTPVVDGVRDSAGAGSYGAVPLAVQKASVIDILLNTPVTLSAQTNNANVGGVAGFNAVLNFPPPDTDPATVTTGVEFAVPLAEIGATGLNLRMAAFVNSGGHTFLSNQVVGGLLPETPNLGDPLLVDFNAFPGNQYVTIPTTRVAAVATVDGVKDGSGYPVTPLFTGGLATHFGNGSSGMVDETNGSEIDAVWAFVSDNATPGNLADDVLFVLISGNLETNFNKLDVFFDVGAGAGQNQIRDDNADIDFNALNNMGGAADGMPGSGLLFDTGFTADYYFNYGGDPTFHCMNMATMPTAGGGVGMFACDDKVDGVLMGAGPTGGTILADSDNSNTGGVAGVVSGAGSDPPFDSDPAAVTTGFEMKIGLDDIGYAVGSGDPVGIAAFILGFNWDYMSNQVMGGLPLGTGNLGFPAKDVDFSMIAGDQVKSLAVPTSLPAVSIGIDGTRDAAYGAPLWVNNASGSGNATGFGNNDDPNVDRANGSEMDAVYAVAGLDAGQPTLFVFVAGNIHDYNKMMLFFDVKAGGQNDLRGDNFPIDNNGFNNGLGGPDGLQFDAGFAPDYAVAYQLGLNGNGTPEPVDDFVEHFVDGVELLTDGGGYGGRFAGGVKNGVAMPLTGTILVKEGFGNNTDPSVGNANGSELDNVYAQLGADPIFQNPMLYLHIGGNLATNFDKLEIFLDVDPSVGQNTLIYSDLPPDDPNYDGNPVVDGGFHALNRMGGPYVVVAGDPPMIIENRPGMTFDAGFAADYYFMFTNGNFDSIGTDQAEIFGHYARLRDVSAPGDPGVSRYLGRTRTGDGGFFEGGDNGFNEIALCDINNSNTGGVAGGEDPFQPDTTNPATVSTGIEIGIPLADLGSWNGQTGGVKLHMFLNREAHNFVSNQSLQHVCSFDLGEPRDVLWGDLQGSQFMTLVYSAASTRYTNSTPAPDECEPPVECPGDLDGDQDVDTTDLNILLSGFGCAGGGCPGDVDGDGDTDTTDLNIVLSAFGTTCD